MRSTLSVTFLVASLGVIGSAAADSAMFEVPPFGARDATSTHEMLLPADVVASPDEPAHQALERALDVEEAHPPDADGA